MTNRPFNRIIPAILVLLTGVSLAGPVAAFDDDRKGFTLGLGMGFSPWARLRGRDAGADLEENAMGFAGSFKAGLGLTDRDILALDGNLAIVNSDLYGDTSHQSFTGFTWTHYFGNPGRSFFGTLGYGDYKYDWQGSRHYICWGDACDPPPALPIDADRRGYLVGAGYEFTLHWQVGAYAAWGRPAYEGDFSFTHLTVLLQYTWF